MSADLYSYIPADARHVPFIADTWMQSFRKSPTCAGMSDDLYYPWMKRHMSAIIERAGAIVCVDPEDDDSILGYVVFEGKLIHYGYTRNGYRKEKVFQTLRNVIGATGYTHRSRNWDHERGGLLYVPWFVAGG